MFCPFLSGKVCFIPTFPSSTRKSLVRAALLAVDLERSSLQASRKPNEVDLSETAVSEQNVVTMIPTKSLGGDVTCISTIAISYQKLSWGQAIPAQCAAQHVFSTLIFGHPAVASHDLHAHLSPWPCHINAQPCIPWSPCRHLDLYGSQS